MRRRMTVIILCASSILLGQARDGSSCVLETAKDGDAVKFRGEVFPTGHDVFIRPSGCAVNPANRVILVWADDSSLGAPKASVRKDAAFSEFNRLLKATLPLPSNGVGVGEARYEVVADFEGRLEVAPSAGLKRDPQGKKVIGIEGFGHPMPFTRFRLVSSGVSRIESMERQPMPQHEAQHAVEPALKKQ
jgi:hypothetical protein